MVKPYLTTDDIMERYDVGRSNAQRIIRSIKEVNARGNGANIRGALGKGKVLYTELVGSHHPQSPLSEKSRCVPHLSVCGHDHAGDFRHRYAQLLQR